jgi:hypothetical protein
MTTEIALANATMAYVLNEFGFLCCFTTRARTHGFNKALQFIAETRVLVVFVCGESSEVGGRQRVQFSDRAQTNGEVEAFLRAGAKPAMQKPILHPLMRVSGRCPRAWRQR